jgi:hypothetical protein
MNEKTDLIRRMNRHLEDACAYHTIREKELFCYCVGRAEAIRDLLEDYYGFFENEYSTHTSNMWEIVDEW